MNGLKEHKYRVLIASSNEKFDDVLLSLLPKEEFDPIYVVTSASAARRELHDKSYDLLLVNTPLQDERGINLAVDAAIDTGAGVLLFIDAQWYDEVTAHTEEYGVLTVSKPTKRSVVTHTIRLMCATRQRLKRMEKKAQSFEEKIAEIKTVNRAKLLLMEKEGLSEDEAHKLILREAMDSRLTRQAVAQEIIERLGG
ncbi:MAG: ANTAR domain-containing protein [Clostridiales bacterium]|nr:ANTAR domain-containing protein [Clostridiales bacterium]